MLDLSKGQIEIPQERVSATKKKLQRACQLQRLPARELASIVGKIISMGLAIGPVSRFMTRSMYSLLETRDLVRSAGNQCGCSPRVGILESLFSRI